jgi:hypothetical protein
MGYSIMVKTNVGIELRHADHVVRLADVAGDQEVLEVVHGVHDHPIDAEFCNTARANYAKWLEVYRRAGKLNSGDRHRVVEQ